LTSKEFDYDPDSHLGIFMELLGHDVLNNNQAVLSYLELIMASPCMDQKTRKYAERATSQIRSSALLIETCRRVMAAKGDKLGKLAPTELLPSVKKATENLRHLFPERKIHVKIAPEGSKAEVFANEILDDLVLNVLVTAVQLDLTDDVRIKLDITPADREGKNHWTIRVENANAHIPPTLTRDLWGPNPPQDRSKMVKMAGLLFARMMAETIDAHLEADELVKGGSTPGCALTLHLRRADSP